MANVNRNFTFLHTIYIGQILCIIKTGKFMTQRNKHSFYQIYNYYTG